MTDDLERRIGDLELAVLALAVEEFGDLPGHPFRGNQHSGGIGEGRQGRSAADILARAAARTPAQDAKAAYIRAKDDADHDTEAGFANPEATAKARALLDEIDRRSGPNVSDATNMDRAQKLANYEKMHGTAAMLAKMTPAEREAHAVQQSVDSHNLQVSVDEHNRGLEVHPDDKIAQDQHGVHPETMADARGAFEKAKWDGKSDEAALADVHQFVGVEAARAVEAELTRDAQRYG